MKCKSFSYVVLSLAVLSVWVWASPAGAVVVLPGDYSVPISGTTAFLRPELVGTVIAPDQTFDFTLTSSSGAQMQGTYTSRVEREDVAGTLDFYYQVTSSVSNPSSFAITPSMSWFSNFATDADYRTDSTGTEPLERVSRSAGLGDTLAFYQENVYLAPGEWTYWMMIKTNATMFDNQGRLDIEARTPSDSNGTDIVVSNTAYEPVPEPSTLALLGVGAFSLLAYTWRRRRAS
ncbi:MAG: PEP-CTERM sorting domain-containing protein [Thermoguttaceae bacterium]|jgi:hypothetical protein